MRKSLILNRPLGATVAVALMSVSPAAQSAEPTATRRVVPHEPVRTPQFPRARVGLPPAGSERPTREVLLSTGEGELVSLPAAVTDVWVSNPTVADVYVQNSRQINLFGKEFGEATVFATDAAGHVVYSASIRVSQNISSVDKVLRVAMPNSDVHVQLVGQFAVLTGTVPSPDDVAQVQAIVTSLLNPGIDPNGGQLKIGIINQLKSATPLQVMLKVKFAEVSRTFVKNISSNVATQDKTGGFTFGVGSGRSPGSLSPSDLSAFPTAQVPLPGGGVITGPYDPSTGQFVNPNGRGIANIAKGNEFTTLGLAGHLLGLDILQAIDLGERNGLVSTLAEPNLSAISGETASFLAGGEFPIPISQGLGAVSVEYKQYGISLSYTPTVLADGRISLRVRPEVSQLTSAGSVQVNGTTIPALSTRRAETTVELGSGQSMMIAGLLQNDHNNSIEQTPGLANVPILGALLRSNGFQRNETELVIVITPYLVKPVNDGDIVLPTDGYKAPTDFERVFLGKLADGQNGGERPKPSVAPPPGAAPGVGISGAVPVAPAQPQTPVPAPVRREEGAPPPKPAAKPGFSFQ